MFMSASVQAMAAPPGGGPSVTTTIVRGWRLSASPQFPQVEIDACFRGANARLLEHRR